MDEKNIKKLTMLMRKGKDNFWVILRRILVERKIDFDRAILVESFEDDLNCEYGKVMTKDNEVYQFWIYFSDGKVREIEWREVLDNSDEEELAIARKLIRERF